MNAGRRLRKQFLHHRRGSAPTLRAGVSTALLLLLLLCHRMRASRTRREYNVVDRSSAVRS